MTTAYDLADLTAKLKSRGLDVAEEAAKVIVEEACNWFEESARLSATPFDDVTLAVIPVLKKSVLDMVDRIDGKVG